MHTSPIIRKVFEGVATRAEMYRLFNRHRGDPGARDDARHLFEGEWFEVAEREHDHMFEILPPLWMGAEMFAMREFMIDSVTSVFFALSIGGRRRFFHSYCDVSNKEAPHRMRRAIVERESRPHRAMTRAERLEHIWSTTHDDYRGYIIPDSASNLVGKRTVLFYGGSRGSVVKLLDNLTDTEISAKLPVHLRYLPDAVAA